MRRGFSISLVLLFLLAPLAMWLPGADESSLPMCCRRHGGHHCAASAGTADPADGTHTVTAPAHCPRYAASAPATLAALLVPAPPQAVSPEERRLAPLPVLEFHLAATRTLADRGPPSAS